MLFFGWVVLCASAVIGQADESDPFYNKGVNDYPDYAERESQTRLPLMQLRALQQVSRVGSVNEAARLFNFAGLTYCSDNVTGIPGSAYMIGLGPSFQVKFIFEDKGLDARGLIAIDNSRRQVLLGFRGTASTTNWRANFKFGKRKFTHGHVHSGFKQLSDALLPKYRSTLIEMLNANPTYRLVVVGHSLGGALAVLSTTYMAGLASWQRLSVYTYGQPRVGDRDFAMWLNSQPMEMTRVVNGNDSVPHLPPNFAGFYHAHTEVFLLNQKVTICSTQEMEDNSCSRSYVDLQSRDMHSVAFGLKLDKALCSSPGQTN